MRPLLRGLCLLLTLAGAAHAAADVSTQTASPANAVEPNSADAARLVPLAGAVNVRDLGGLDGAHGPIPLDRFIRAANLAHLTAADRSTLYSHHVVLDIDLRTPDEERAHPDVLANDPAIRYLPISLLGKQLALSNPPPTLGALYRDTLEHHQAEFKQIFEAIADVGPGGVLYHCTVGKDRTGMVSALLLDLAGVPRDEIVHNYAVSAYYLKPMMASADMKALLARPGMAALMDSPPEAIEAFLDELDTRYGGTAAYLKTIGVSGDDIAKIRARLVS